MPTMFSRARLSRTVLMPHAPMPIAPAPKAMSITLAMIPPYSKILRDMATPFLVCTCRVHGCLPAWRCHPCATTDPLRDSRRREVCDPEPREAGAHRHRRLGNGSGSRPRRARARRPAGSRGDVSSRPALRGLRLRSTCPARADRSQRCRGSAGRGAPGRGPRGSGARSHVTPRAPNGFRDRHHRRPGRGATGGPAGHRVEKAAWAATARPRQRLARRGEQGEGRGARGASGFYR